MASSLTPPGPAKGCVGGSCYGGRRWRRLTGPAVGGLAGPTWSGEESSHRCTALAASMTGSAIAAPPSTRISYQP